MGARALAVGWWDDVDGHDEAVEPGVATEAGARCRILVADADPRTRACLVELLRSHGHDVASAEEGQAALNAFAGEDFDLVFLDLELPGVAGMNVLAALPAIDSQADVVVFTAVQGVESVVEAMKLGAYEYLTKPADSHTILRVVQRARRERALRKEVQRLRTEVPTRSPGGLVGRSPAMRRLLSAIARVAVTRASVLITGETGTGKELVARAIHECSPRSRRPFVDVHCSAIPHALLESELFGHVRGAFTGAVASRKGLVEEADGGTLFLDEVGTLTPDVQVRLLRLLQERRIQRVGSSMSTPVDFRLVAASNVDLRDEVGAGHFREDLFFRLDVCAIRVPPLRERTEDVPLLAHHFLTRFATEYGIEPPRLTPEVLARMVAYDWPGNVRELEHFVERSLVMHPGASSIPFDLPHGTSEEGPEPLVQRALDEDWSLDRLERVYILRRLERNGWQRSATAEQLGIDRRTIHRKLKRYREEGLLAEVVDTGALG
ncbi:MAG: sigma-54 dependent transcriptional regulator [Gemmatimonadota bacterium]